MEHVEDLETWLMDGEDDCAVRVSQFVEVGEQLHGRGGIKSCRDGEREWCVCVCACT